MGALCYDIRKGKRYAFDISKFLTYDFFVFFAAM